MTNQKLLELAARAAGLPWEQWVVDGDSSWNPLKDDGDTLRLSAQLKIDVRHNDPDSQNLYVVAERKGCIGMFGPVCQIEEFEEEKDRAYAIRRAIVRAAAVIGKVMP